MLNHPTLRACINGILSQLQFWRIIDMITLYTSESQSMGNPAYCMILSGVRLMGSKVLQYTKDTSLWAWVLLPPWAPVQHEVQLKKIWGREYHTRVFSPARQSQSWRWRIPQGSDCWEGFQNHDTILLTTGNHFYHTWYHSITMVSYHNQEWNHRIWMTWLFFSQMLLPVGLKR